MILEVKIIMLRKRVVVVDPLVVGFVVTILVVSTLILSGSTSAESKSINKYKNYDYGHGEYGKNVDSHDEYSYEDNEDNNDNHIENILSV